ncbi:beta-N-acetylglucosaminidase domain-containing protein [Streptomyces sp. VRA16 Mangrove soil]|uniref:beta-N-acetylglucosaminidase domain-containing protein n=1 Tax=Streptomyces sp. VRA16 Mangrove soil TaxID=2817434 RepID=UPI001A9F1862|nr:beta-N-acetylglucosaminidase domain-containing protein [Streptomyces sp. VRA16 Mangrove soil]MBO1329955.1 beta-N-acetylglucosaminidase domain-containing protein [Streptomyces sp. VRA16 Mangrove soil]
MFRTKHRSRRTSRIALMAAVAAAALTAAPLSFGSPMTGTGSGSGSGSEASAPTITPTPRSEQRRTDRITVTPSAVLVVGEDSDPAAVRLTTAVLKAAGARDVTLTRHAPAGNDRLTVFVGGPAENPASAAALDSLHTVGPSGLAAEGYVLALGGPGAGRIVLSGVDPTGTYYAAQSLRQVLPHRRTPGADVRGLTVRDWPSTPLRGVIEGFYGTPWSHAARLDQLDDYGEHKMNIYVYSPKDDPYLRAKWRDAYPAEQLAQIKELVDRATAHHVEFTYALSPGLSVCYSSDDDLKALTDKFQTLWDIGVRQFAVPLDDISYTNWNCDADKVKWGTGGGAAGQAQAYLLNRVNQQFIKTHDGALPLQMVPTEYYNTTSSPYKTALSGQLDPDVLVEWTGEGVVAPTMTVDQAKRAKDVFGHPILTWDNYPVNDYATGRLFLGPFVGREKGLAEQLAGITANPMIQPYASKLALHTVADYTWNDEAYDPDRAYAAAVREAAGGSARVERALRAFTDVNHSSPINSVEAPDLSKLIKGYWDGSVSASRLSAAFAALRDAPATIRDGVEPGFVEDAGPWLDSAQAWGVAGVAALRMLDEQKAGHTAAAWTLRQQLPGLIAKAKSFRYTDLNGNKVPVIVGEGVLDPFFVQVRNASNAALGLPPQPTATTGLPVYNGNTADRMTDGDDSTYFWSSRAPRTGESVVLDLGAEQPLGPVTVAMAKPGSADDYLHRGVLEYSADGTTWHALGSEFSGKATWTADAPAGTTARYVRARATGDQDNWLVVKEFTVAGADHATVSGGPAAAEGSSLAAAADGSPESAYRAASAPAAGDALTVASPAPRAVASVTVLRPDTATASKAQVQLRVDGAWRSLGALDGSVTTLAVPAGTRADAVRLAWDAGSDAPVVSEVVVR